MPGPVTLADGQKESDRGPPEEYEGVTTRGKPKRQGAFANTDTARRGVISHGCDSRVVSSPHGKVHGPGTGTSHSERAGSLPCVRRKVRQVLLAAAVLHARLPVGDQSRRHEQRGRVRRRRNAAELVAWQLFSDLYR